jgi:hypothetical protein
MLCILTQEDIGHEKSRESEAVEPSHGCRSCGVGHEDAGGSEGDAGERHPGGEVVGVFGDEVEAV